MRITTILLAVFLLLAGAVYLLRDLPPPSQITFAAGPRDGGYWQIAEQYRTALSADGIELELLETAGSVENLGLLATGRADVGLLQGGIPARDLGLVALGTVFVEPLVVFAQRHRTLPSNPGLWSGLTIARGTPGSGTQVAVQALLNAIGVAERNTLSDLGGEAAAMALLSGQVDLAIFVAPLQADYLDLLLDAPEVDLLPLSHIEAISLRLPHSQVIRIPSGALSLAPVLPAREFAMVSLMARLAAVGTLHPAVVDRLMLAARKIHGDSSVLARQGQFPSAEGTDMQIDPGALKLLAEGRSGFHEWLPYWIAAQIRRVLLVVLPLVFVVIPLFRVLPGLYRWSMHRRVWRFYNEIRSIEMELAATDAGDEMEALDIRLAEIDRQLGDMRLPPPFRASAYNARLHVELIRRRIASTLERPAEI